MITLDTVCSFTWGFNHEFFLETEGGDCYIWSDPGYPEGDNTIRKTYLSYREWSKPFWGRDKGRHRVRDYCGEDVRIID